MNISRGDAPSARPVLACLGWEGFGAWEGCLEISFWDVLGSKWVAWEIVLGVYFGSCRTQVGVWEAKRQEGRGLEGLGLETCKWTQHGSNLSQVGANLGPTWAQDEPTWSQLGPKMGTDWLK